MNRKMVVVGSSNTDMIIKTSRIPNPGETVIGGTFSTAAGGKGANQAVAAARAGGDVALVARVGADIFGERAVDGYRQDHVDVSYVTKDTDQPTGVALILVDDHGENSIAVASGANGELSPEDVHVARDAIATARVVLLQLEVPLATVQTAITIAAKAGSCVILNPAPAQPLEDEMLKMVTILTPNEGEAEMLTGIQVRDDADANRAADALLERGVGAVVITLGARGAFVRGEGISELIPGFPVETVDTTAAGDVFNGALAVSLADGKDLREAVRFASAAGALAATKLGAQPSAPSRQEILACLEESC